MDSKWSRVGYMVSDVLADVHEAINSKKIVSVELEWIIDS